MVGNKDDLYSEEEVSYKEGLEFAKEINAIYQKTSAKYESGGIDVLFENIVNFILVHKKVIFQNIIEFNSLLDKKNVGEFNELNKENVRIIL